MRWSIVGVHNHAITPGLWMVLRSALQQGPGKVKVVVADNGKDGGFGHGDGWQLFLVGQRRLPCGCLLVFMGRARTQVQSGSVPPTEPLTKRRRTQRNGAVKRHDLLSRTDFRPSAACIASSAAWFAAVCVCCATSFACCATSFASSVSGRSEAIWSCACPAALPARPPSGPRTTTPASST